MKKILKSKIFILGFITCLIVIMTTIYIGKNNVKEKKYISSYSIDDILKSESYSYLPESSKEYIKEKYEETGEVILTEKNKEDNLPYLNPAYVEYLELSEEDQKELEVIPSETITNIVFTKSQLNELRSASFAARYDLRNYGRINTSNKNQGSLGLCVLFGFVGSIESNLLSQSPSKSVTFNERQIDYALSEPKVEYEGIFTVAPLGTQTLQENYSPYSYKPNGAPVSLESLNKLIVNGVIPVENQSNTKWNSYFEDFKNYSLKDVFDYSNITYNITNYYSLKGYARGDQTDDTISAIKSAVVNYGSVAMASKAPQEDCFAYLENGDVVINTNYCLDGKSSATDHEMQIIGWDDNYHKEYCVDSTFNNTSSNNTKAKCESGGGKWATINGAWILKNSWGTFKQYPYLSYDSAVQDPIVITDVKEKNWNNNYSLPLSKTDKKYKMDMSEMTFLRQNYSNERIKRITFYSNVANANYSVYLKTGSEYEKVGEINRDYPGLISIETNKLIPSNCESFSIKVDIEKDGNTGYFISEPGIGVFTYIDNLATQNNVLSKVYKSDEEYSNEYNIISLNKQTGALINTVITDNQGNDETSKFNVVGNYIINGKAKITIKEKSGEDLTGVYNVKFYTNNELLGTSNFNANSGSGTSTNPYRIIDEEGFINFITNTDLKKKGYYFRLENDLNFTELTKKSTNELSSSGKYACFKVDNSGQFSGVFDGNNHSIIGINICNSNTVDSRSIFGDAEDATIKNLSILNLNVGITGSGNNGVLFRNVYGQVNIDNVKILGDINFVNDSSVKAILVGENHFSDPVNISNVQIIGNLSTPKSFSNSNLFVRYGPSNITDSYVLLNVDSSNYNGKKFYVKYSNSDSELSDLSDLSNLSLNNTYWMKNGSNDNTFFLDVPIATSKTLNKYVELFNLGDGNDYNVIKFKIGLNETKKINNRVALDTDLDLPSGVDYNKMYYFSSNPELAIVTNDGYITRKKDGMVYIYAVSFDGSYAQKIRLSDIISFDEKKYTYDGNTHDIKQEEITSTSGSGVTVKYYSDNTCNTLATPKNAGIYYITASTSYGELECTKAITINKASGSISYKTTTVNKTTDSSTFTNSLTKTGDGTVTYTSSNTSVATVNSTTGEVTVKGAGTATITATVKDGTNYTYTNKTASYTLNVTNVKSPNPMTVTTPVQGSKVYKTTGTVINLKDKVSNAQGEVTYEITSQKDKNNTNISTDTFTMDGSTLKLNKTLDVSDYVVVVKVTAAGNTNYESKTSNMTVNVQITKANDSVTVNYITVGYDGKSKSTTGTSTSESSVTFKYYSDNTCNTEATPKNAGEYYAKGTSEGNTNYNSATSSCTKAITINKASGSISYQTTTVNKTTDSSTFTNSLTKTGDGTVTYTSSSTSVATVNSTTGEVTIKGAGTATITATLKDGTNYTYTNKTASYTLNVTNANYKIKFNLNGAPGEIDDIGVTYNGNLPTISFEKPTREKYKFVGWFDDVDYSKGNKYYDASGNPLKEKYDLKTDIILYAGWEYVGSYEIDFNIDKNNYIKNIKLNTTVSQYMNNLSVDGIYKIEILNNKNEKISNNDLVGTGSKILIYENNDLKYTYTNIILGDVTGDGTVNISDVSKLYRFLRGKIKMADCYVLAGNVVSTDNEIKISDVSKLYRYLRGKINSLR